MVSVDASLILIPIWGFRKLHAAAKWLLHFGTMEDGHSSWELASLGNLGGSTLDLEIARYYRISRGAREDYLV